MLKHFISVDVRPRGGGCHRRLHKELRYFLGGNRHLVNVLGDVPAGDTWASQIPGFKSGFFYSFQKKHSQTQPLFPLNKQLVIVNSFFSISCFNCWSIPNLSITHGFDGDELDIM